MKFNTRLPVSCLKSYLKRSFSNEGKNTNILKPSYFHNPGKEPLSCLTVGRLITEAAEKYGDREAIVSVHQNQRLTFNDLDTQVNKFAAGLLEMGLQRGDRVGIWSFNCSEWCIVSGAVAKAGLMLVNINPAFQSSELEYCLQKVGVKALITASSFKTQNYYQLLLNILPELKTSVPGNINSEKFPTFKSLIIMNEDRLQGSFRYSDIMELGSTSSLEKIKQLEEEIQPDHPWNIQFTSGTTGNAKATLLTHHNTVNNSYGTGKRMELDKKSHRICLQVPFFHCFGCVIGYLASLHYGSTLVLPSPHFKAKESLHAIEKEKCTIVFGTPTMHVDMVSEVKQRNIVLESLETVVTGGAPISEHLCHELYNTLAVKQICVRKYCDDIIRSSLKAVPHLVSVFGMTETSPVTFQTLPTDSIEQITTTFGYLSDHIEAKVVDSENRIVPMGTPGELCVRGYANMLGYWNDDVSTKKMIGQDHWLKTGDQVILLENGYGRIVGRLKDMIIRGGENIFPKEIEDFLQTHKDILEAQVFGVPDYRMGEEVCCCLTVKNGAALTEQDLREYCKGKISHFKVPKYFRFINEFPKTTSGKIQKFKLREQALKDLNLNRIS